MKPLAPVDPNVKVPGVVARHGASADEIQKAYIASLNPPNPEEGGTDPEPAPEPDPEPQPDPAPEPDPEPQPDPTTQPKAAAQPDPTKSVSAEEWQRRYDAMKGRWEREERANRELSERLSNMERTLALMSTPPAETVPVPVPNSITQEDIDTYGPEFFDAVKRAASDMIAPLKAELEAKLTQVGSTVSSVVKVVQKDARQTMEELLNREVPDWLKINEDNNFIEWLQEYDLLTGDKRHDMLRNAWGKNDGTRVANFFKLFLGEQNITSADPLPPSGARSTAPTVSLGAFAAPGKAKPAAPPKDGPAKQPISRQYITKFYADVAAGKWASNPQRQNEIERDIFAAQAEGRIT